MTDKKKIASLLSLYPRGIALTLLTLISFGVYFNSLSNGFVFDDSFQILQNRYLTDTKFIPEIFTTNLWSFLGDKGSGKSYRPFVFLVGMLNYHIFGFQPWGFHLTNVLFHIINTILVFLLSSLLFRRYLSDEKHDHSPIDGQTVKNYYVHSFIIALIFALHPVNTEPVNWASALSEISYSCFFLLSFYLYVRSDMSKRAVSLRIFSLVFFFIATLFKETALILIPLFISYDYFLKKDLTISNIIILSFKRYSPYVLACLLNIFMRISAMGGSLAPGRFEDQEISAFKGLVNIFPILTQYIEKLIFPVDLNAFYSFGSINHVDSFFEFKSIVYAVINVLLFFILFKLRRDGLLVFASLLIMIPLLPALYIPFVWPAVFADRYLYLSSVGFAILVTVIYVRSSVLLKSNLSEKTCKYMAVILTFLIVIVLSTYATITANRNYVWRDGIALWSDVISKSPDNVTAYNGLGHHYAKKGDWDRAFVEFKKALEINPERSQTHYNIAGYYYKKGLLDDAIREYNKTIQLNPNKRAAYFSLGIVYEKKGLIDRAITTYQRALEADPSFDMAHYNLGVLYFNQGLIDEAIFSYRNALKYGTDDAVIRSNLGNAYLKKGQLNVAESEYRRALEIDPDFILAHYNLGIVYKNTGRIDLAGAQFKEVLRIDPYFTGAQRMLRMLEKP